MPLTLGLANAIARWRARQQAAALLVGEHYVFLRRYMEISEPHDCYRHGDKLYFGNTRNLTAFRRIGLRITGHVTPERLDIDEDMVKLTLGWFTNNHGEYTKSGEGLVVGIVFQLPADRDGHERFVAGYKVDDSDIVVDLEQLFTERDSGKARGQTSAVNLDACRDAARLADSMARDYAEAERDYQQEQEDAAAAEDGVEENQAENIQQEKEDEQPTPTAAYRGEGRLGSGRTETSRA